MKKLLIEQGRTIITLIFFIAFLIFSIYQIINATNLTTCIFYIILTIVMLSIAFYSEYFRLLYQKATKTLLFNVDTTLAKEQFNHLMKKDILHAYKNSEAIFDTLYFADEMRPEECLKTLEKNNKYFHGSLDSLLIYHYTKFYANFLQNKYEVTIAEYSHIIRLKETKIKGKKISPLYNWEFIDAIYQFARKDYRQSLKIFNNIDDRYMNQREKMHMYYQKGNLNLILKKQRDALDCFENSINLGGTSKMKEASIKLRKKVQK